MGRRDRSDRVVVVLVVLLMLAACTRASSTSAPPATVPRASTQIPPRSPAATASPASSTPARANPVTLGGLIAPGAKIEFVAAGLVLAEGPLWLPDGRLIVSDVPGDVVAAVDATGRMGDFRRPSNQANGHALDGDGSVVQAEQGDATTPGRITRLTAQGPGVVLADSFQGRRFNSPNDLVVKSDGTIWFTDPDYGLAGTSAIGFNGVYRLDPRTGAVTLLTSALGEPNGIAFSPDEKTLYVSDSEGAGVAEGAGVVVAFTVDDGSIGPGTRLGGGCDGIGVDELGDVWASSCGPEIVVTDPHGREIGSITFPGDTTNLAWGGQDGRTLFVTTTGGSVWRLRLTVGEAR
jgi:gluconolactonase